MSISKTKARALARQARRYGYFNRGPDPDYGGGDRLEVPCPVCRSPVVTTQNYKYFPTKKYVDPEYRKETVIEALDRAVIDHVTNWCEADSHG